ncbi:MAG: hypothetical protein ABIH18_04970, partial [Candidatus Omnitrophota bacterium]
AIVNKYFNNINSQANSNIIGILDDRLDRVTYVQQDGKYVRQRPVRDQYGKKTNLDEQAPLWNPNAFKVKDYKIQPKELKILTPKTSKSNLTLLGDVWAKVRGTVGSFSRVASADGKFVPAQEEQKNKDLYYIDLKVGEEYSIPVYQDNKAFLDESKEGYIKGKVIAIDGNKVTYELPEGKGKITEVYHSDVGSVPISFVRGDSKIIPKSLIAESASSTKERESSSKILPVGTLPSGSGESWKPAVPVNPYEQPIIGSKPKGYIEDDSIAKVSADTLSITKEPSLDLIAPILKEREDILKGKVDFLTAEAPAISPSLAKDIKDVIKKDYPSKSRQFLVAVGSVLTFGRVGLSEKEADAMLLQDGKVSQALKPWRSTKYGDTLSAAVLGTKGEKVSKQEYLDSLKERFSVGSHGREQLLSFYPSKGRQLWGVITAGLGMNETQKDAMLLKDGELLWALRPFRSTKYGGTLTGWLFGAKGEKISKDDYLKDLNSRIGQYSKESQNIPDNRKTVEPVKQQAVTGKPRSIPSTVGNPSVDLQNFINEIKTEKMKTINDAVKEPIFPDAVGLAISATAIDTKDVIPEMGPPIPDGYNPVLARRQQQRLIIAEEANSLVKTGKATTLSDAVYTAGKNNDWFNHPDGSGYSNREIKEELYGSGGLIKDVADYLKIPNLDKVNNPNFKGTQPTANIPPSTNQSVIQSGKDEGSLTVVPNSIVKFNEKQTGYKIDNGGLKPVYETVISEEDQKKYPLKNAPIAKDSYKEFYMTSPVSVINDPNGALFKNLEALKGTDPKELKKETYLSASPELEKKEGSNNQGVRSYLEEKNTKFNNWVKEREIKNQKIIKAGVKQMWNSITGGGENK